VPYRTAVYKLSIDGLDVELDPTVNCSVDEQVENVGDVLSVLSRG